MMNNQPGCRLFNDEWAFALCPLDTTLNTLPDPAGFAPVALPHDWLIGRADRLYEDGAGWYRRVFTWDGAASRELLLRFEGVYMDSTVYLNGAQAAVWKYGYSTFEVNLTPFLRPGENILLVRAAYQCPNSRWYSGAGIYRDVWLKNRPAAAHLLSDGSYITTAPLESGDWSLHVTTELSRQGFDAPLRVEYRLLDLQTGAFVPLAGGSAANCAAADGVQTVDFSATVPAPALWDAGSPCRYRLSVCLYGGDVLLQQEDYTVGFRTIEFSPDRGFLLNGQHVKLNGVCEHHDLGCLGAAYNSSAMRRKLKTLAAMGVNALRLTHNMPAPDVMELADELGFLIVSEAFDMWERPKNAYDYARFFDDWYQRDVAAWVRRDRNHPSLILWSIGNEISDTHVDGRGQTITGWLCDEVKKHDPAAHAGITIGSNYMPWENAQRCADIVKLAGYNYSEKYYAAHHKAHPDWVIYGSETASTVQSRGIYHFPLSQSVLADEDEQCSALGNSTTSWGAKSSETCILAERDCAFSCGQFLWSGHDYIGEPTPYHTRNSYFGQIDTAGFAKDSYYIYQAEWTDCQTAPMVHLFPYWCFNEGQLIDVRVCSNAPEVELFLNGQSLGRRAIDHRHGSELVPHWQLPYMPGVLCARAYDTAGRLLAQEERRSFGDAVRLVATPDRTALSGSGSDLAFVEITALDAAGNPVENAANRVHVAVEGAGYLAGLDNGDSTDTDEYKTASRRLFSGKLLAVAAALPGTGSLRLTVSADGLAPAFLELPVLPAGIPAGQGAAPHRVPAERLAAPAGAVPQPVRAICLHSDGPTRLDKAHPRVLVTAALCPADATDQDVQWSVVDDSGTPSFLAEVQPDGLTAAVAAKSDGAFRLRCLSHAGTAQVRVISSLNFTVTGFGKAWLDPYNFIAGSLYDAHRGEPGNGNEHGFSTARDGETQVCFHGIDFGTFGSDEITLPIFALTDEEYPIELWEGMPGEPGAGLIDRIVYQKPSQWNVYQPETYHLSRRLRGVTSLCFVLRQKIHLKGFSFTRLEKAYQTLPLTECDTIYGDSFTRTAQGIEKIGNNVTICYTDMDFASPGAGRVVLCGHTPLEKNAIQLRFANGEGETVQMLEFANTEGWSEQCFPLKALTGSGTLQFVFLPGCNFDFRWFRFEKAAPAAPTDC